MVRCGLLAFGMIWLIGAAAPGGTTEKLDRGLIARPAGEGRVYLGWRLLESDGEDAAFNVYRRAEGGEPKRLNAEPVRKTTDFVDEKPAADAVWFVRPVLNGREGEASPDVRLAAGDECIAIPLQGDYRFQKIGIADLDGDRRYDYVIKQPQENIDPYEKYWKPSPDTYKLEAYAADGRLLWRHDLGWSIERGIWYSPYLVADLDGDGRAEVAAKTGEGDPRDADGRVQQGPEYLSLLDGASGKPITRIDWPPRTMFAGEGARSYNLASRNQLGLAWLDGPDKNPSLVVARGTYTVMVVAAYDLAEGKLRERWRWDNLEKGKEYRGQGAHGMHAADIDGDGRQEVLLGSVALDDNGRDLWTTGLGHPDHFYVGEIDPERPGLEIYFGIETRRREGNGMCLADARTGKLLWGIEEPTQHVHGQGLCSDIDAHHAGAECYSAESDPAKGKSLAWARLHSAKGEVIDREPMGGFAPLAAWWDADPQRELVIDGRVRDYGSDRVLQKIEGKVVAVADVVGDWREEILVTAPGELRIYTTTIPATSRRTCLMEDPIYRVDVAHAAMGYYQVPMTSR